jgi:antitoxin ParD1/3/4
MQSDKAERITITLSSEMLVSIKNKVQSGAYGSTSELIREVMRLWQRKEEEHEARLSLIRDRLSSSAQSGVPVPLDEAFKAIEQLHQKRGDIYFI